jgi:hypothetical protein
LPYRQCFLDRIAEGLGVLACVAEPLLIACSLIQLDRWPRLALGPVSTITSTSMSSLEYELWRLNDGAESIDVVTVFDQDLSAESVEDYVHDALHLGELSRVQGVGHLDMSVAFPLDRDD